MRMTNKIMRNNSLYNINQNKILEDKLTNQMTNQSKIVRPSDDPVVAIRALRLRSNVNSVTQYHDKNAADADQWLTVTADALNTIDEVLKDLYSKATGAANKYLTSEDLSIILEQMKSLTKEFYASGNVDYAGRYVFSGFRTDTAITFSAEDIAQMEKHPVSYEIKENIGFANISTISYTDLSVLADGRNSLNGVTNGNGGTGPLPDESYEQYVTNNTLYRFRLSYDDVDATAAGGTFPLQMTDKDGNPIQLMKEDTTVPPTTPPTMVPIGQTFTEYADAETAYKDIVDGKCEGIAYIPSTGELVFSEQVYKDNFKEGDDFQVTYNKSNWVEGDINPVHYFPCVETKDDGKKIAYNTVKADQDIYYDVGFNQKIQVNTVTDEVFTHNVQRDMDDFQHCLNQLKAIETKKSDIEAKMKDLPEDSQAYKDLAEQLKGAEKADTYIRENIQKKFENQITKYQKYRDDNDLAITNNATRGSRLDLITERLCSQKATFKELQTDNEGIDITQVAVELSSSELTYQAALMATGKIMQTNLMNYI
ncbi:MAG: hypothetical protein K2P41_00335 [Lachnospiraceae bacterium]|nr:hypothetical protein [Lachnospiraceae bacterium]